MDSTKNNFIQNQEQVNQIFNSQVLLVLVHVVQVQHVGVLDQLHDCDLALHLNNESI